jgi:hypothetical protein
MHNIHLLDNVQKYSNFSLTVIFTYLEKLLHDKRLLLLMHKWERKCEVKAHYVIQAGRLPYAIF